MVEQVIKTIINYVLPLILGFLIAKVNNYRKKNDGVKNGVMILLQSDLTNTFYYYEPSGEMPDYVYRNFLNKLKSYEDLGGDDYIHDIAERVKKFKIIRTGIIKEK